MGILHREKEGEVPFAAASFAALSSTLAFLPLLSNREIKSVCERERERESERRRWNCQLTLLAAISLPLVLQPVVVPWTSSRLLVRLCELVYMNRVRRVSTGGARRVRRRTLLVSC